MSTYKQKHHHFQAAVFSISSLSLEIPILRKYDHFRWVSTLLLIMKHATSLFIFNTLLWWTNLKVMVKSFTRKTALPLHAPVMTTFRTEIHTIVRVLVKKSMATGKGYEEY